MRRYSRKREAILDLLHSTKTHPTAEWIYEQLKPEIPDLSLSTVYRNLGDFLQEGTVQTVGVYEGQQRFDGDVSPHMHFLCEKCGKLLDIELPVDDIFQRAIENRNGCHIRTASLLFYGSCRECSQKREQSSSLNK